jgi:retinol dehydrogenase-13
MRETLRPVLKYWAQYHWPNVIAMIRNMSASPDTCDLEFRDRQVVITGATSGIGYLTARRYASRGARLLTINRSEEKSGALREEIQRDFGTTCDYLIADLSCLEDIHRVGKALVGLAEPIDVLIHNAGLYLSRRTLTEDGLEMNFAVHFLAPFVINYLLREKMQRDRQGRIIFVNSEGYRFAVWGLRLDDLQWKKRRYGGLKAYGAAKIAQILIMHVLAEELQASAVTVNAMHPGMVRTNTGRENRHLYRWYKQHIIDHLSQPADLSAEALYYLGVSPALAGVTDRFFHLTREEELAPPALDREVAERLWQISLKLGRLQ